VAATAVAEPTYHVARSKIESGPWTFTPIYTQENGKLGQVVSFLALANPSTRVGNNIVAVWYQRDGAGWSAKSWETGDPWEAIKSVKGALGISEDEDDRWGVPGSDFVVSRGKKLITAAEQPKGYTLGVLATDPLAAAVVSSPNKDDVVEFLTSVGYKAADVTLEKDDGCTMEAKLDGLALAMVETLRGDEQTKVDRSMRAWMASGSAGCGFGSEAVEIVPGSEKQISPWTTPSYECKQEIIGDLNDRLIDISCTNQIWTQTSTWTEKQTRARFNPKPPPLYQYCDQIRTFKRTKTTVCSNCGVLLRPPVPCPPAPPAGSPAPGKGACVTGWDYKEPDPTDTTIADWGPACPF
jgi:hypothetical protein